MRPVDIRVGHDNDAAVAEFRDVEGGFVLGRVFISRLSDAGPDGGNHRLNFRVLERLIEARLFHVDQLAANRKYRLIAPVASLLRRSTGGITLDDVKLG